MAKTYIIYNTWSGTKNNHAGMAYLLQELKKSYPKDVKLIKIYSTVDKWPYFIQRLHFHLMVVILKILLKPDNKLLLMEYLGVGAGDHTGIAIKLRSKGVTSELFGMVHLPESFLLNLYGSLEYIKKGAETLDKIVVLGSSLTSFFESLGYGAKIIQTFHYVDNRFYKPSVNPKIDKMQVIHMGCMGRNFDRLTKIVAACPDIDFHICNGKLNLKEQFNHFPNVRVYDFLPENKLLRLMQECHVSLSVFDDTVGSNVITTSMASGLVNVVSDIGSIRDYCNNENSILCRSDNEFIYELNRLNSDKFLQQKLSINSLNRSPEFSIEKSIDFFYNEILK
jgi:glycosyltransferase involved in cell wall biosynthesis